MSEFNYRPLNYNEDYICPVCRNGRISTLAMMETFACNFCQHLFEAEISTQKLTLLDSQFPIIWQWYREKWVRINPDGVEIGWGYLILGILFVLLPTVIVGSTSYLFPPLPGSYLAWLPVFWTILTFLSHLSCFIWLVLEYYQFPWRLYVNALVNSWSN